MASDELTGWQAFDAIDPIGGQRLDLLFAMLAHSAWISSAKGKSRLRMADFLIQWGQATTPETPKQKINRIKAGFTMLGALFRKK